MNRLLALAAAFFLLQSCATKIVTNHIPSTISPLLTDEGVHYFLPQTVVRVSVPVTKLDKKPGPYEDLALIFFPDANSVSVIHAQSSAYSINADAVTITTHGVRDLSQHYVLKPTGQLFADTSFHFVLSEEGVPNEIHAEVDNKSFDVALTVLETAAALGSKVATGGALSARSVENKTGPPPTCPFDGEFTEPQRARFNSLPKTLGDLYCQLDEDLRDVVFQKGQEFSDLLLEYLQHLSVIIDRASLHAARLTIRKFIGARALYVELRTIVDQNPEVLALPSGSLPADTFKALLEARSARVKEILSFFFGSKEKTATFWPGIFDLTPIGGVPSTPVPLFSYSEVSGICGVAADTGSLNLLSPRQVFPACASGETVAVSAVMEATPPVIGPSVAPAGQSGLRYRLPGRGSVRVVAGLEELARTGISVAQFGQIASLAKKTGGMKTQYTVKLDPATGALTDVLVGNTSVINSDQIKRAGGISSTAVATQQKVDEQNAPAKSPSAQQKAEKERALKEEQLRIQLLERCLSDLSQPGCQDLVKPK